MGARRCRSAFLDGVRRIGQYSFVVNVGVSSRPVRVHREVELDASATRVWQAMLQPSTMLYVLRGLFSFPALSGRIDPVTEGESGTGWTLLFHVIPFARWTIKIVRVDPESRTIATKEHGGVIRTWNHTLHVEAVDTNRSRYSDTIEVNAPGPTRITATIVNLMFAYRQRRLRHLARAHLAAAP
jgi:ligand-binding SRPBCC domain-containing protein